MYGNANKQRSIPTCVPISRDARECYIQDWFTQQWACKFIHWLKAPLGLYSAVTFLNIGIAYYGSTDGNPNYNCLVPPLRRTTSVQGVHKTIHVCWVNRKHCVQLFMNDDSSLLSPIQRSWREVADNSCRHLETHFRSRISL